MSTPVEITWLLAAVAKGDAVAFERLYGATCAKLYGIVLRILRRHDLAGEVIEQAYLQIWRDAGDYDPARSTPLAWMVAIARRLAIDVARGPQPPAARADGRSQTAAYLHRAAGTGPAAHAAARLLRRLQPRAAFGQAGHANRSAPRIPAAKPARDRWMS